MKKKFVTSMLVAVIALTGYKIFAQSIATGCYRYPNPNSPAAKKDKELWDKKETNATEEDIRFKLNARDLYELGCVALEKGKGPRAVRFFEKSVQKGSTADSSYNKANQALFTIYKQGIAVPKDLDKAEKHFNKIDPNFRRYMQ